MFDVRLTQEQAELLRGVLDGCLRELRDEIRHTDRRDYRAMLKGQEASLEGLLRSLQDQALPVAA